MIYFVNRIIIEDLFQDQYLEFKKICKYASRIIIF